MYGLRDSDRVGWLGRSHGLVGSARNIAAANEPRLLDKGLREPASRHLKRGDAVHHPRVDFCLFAHAGRAALKSAWTSYEIAAAACDEMLVDGGL